MDPSYWSGFSAGIGLGLSTGLIVTIWIVLHLVSRRPTTPPLPDARTETTAQVFDGFGRRTG